MKEFGRLWRSAERLPGPLWLLGAYGFVRLARWGEALLMQGIAYAGGGHMPYDVLWPDAAIRLGGLVGAALPVFLFGLLAGGSMHAVPLAKWYAGLQCVFHFAALFTPWFAGASDPVHGVHAALANAAACMLWFGLLRYMEGCTVSALFPQPLGRWRYAWAVLPMAAIVLIFG